MYKIKTKVKSLADEKWYGGCVNDGVYMPYNQNFDGVDLCKDNHSNQATSFFVSTKGRYIYFNEPVAFEIKKGTLIISSNKPVEINVYDNIKEAYLAASKKSFKLTNNKPDMAMFKSIQYNTWIEMGYNITEAKVLKYAQEIIDNGFEPGVLMIDDSWQEDYGVWKFNAARFNNPKKMVDKLHELGFKVILWVCPFVSADSITFRKINKEGYLVRDENKKTKIIQWWDGFSACLDLTNSYAMEWFINELKSLQNEFNVDGFKFDAGDFEFYNNAKFLKGNIQASQAFKYGELASVFPFNEFRVTFNNQGQNAIQRLCDKNHSWNNNGLNTLIPNGLAASMLGYRFVCPDMIGGGLIEDFDKDNLQIDQELFVRYAQVATFFPMMQFSIAPWKVLSEENLELVKKCLALHKKLVPYIEELVNKSLETGEPIIRPLEYEYPNSGFEDIKDMFMLGDRYIVAPCLNKNKGHRIVRLPAGMWHDEDGKIYKGNKNVPISTAMNRIPYFEKYVAPVEEEKNTKKSRKTKEKDA